MNKNINYQNLQENYLFKEIGDRAAAYLEAHAGQHLLRMGVGDVTRPLPKVIVEAMQQAAGELGQAETFKGYCLEEGYEWLRQAIIDNEYKLRGIDLDIDEVFIGEGAGSDLGNLSELFATDNRVAIMDPTYPAYTDASIMAGRMITYLPCHPQNGFVPELPKSKADIIYLCLPNNPTGTVLTRKQLELWVEYARKNRSIIIFDAAYEAYITQPDVPHSIYEIDGAKEVAIEVRSYSKSAGFTSVRCGFTIVPKATGLQAMWLRRQCTKYNGTSYVAQRAALATYTPEGKAGIRANLDFYQGTARLIKQSLQNIGYEAYGGENAPYIWCHAPHGWDSWTFFNHLLQECQILCTPGVGFGASGEGYVRLSAFSKREDCEEALKRIQSIM